VLLEIGRHKRIPRNLTAHSDSYFSPLGGVSFQWSDRSETPVFDLSFGGIALPSTGRLQALKVGQIHEGRLKVVGIAEPVPLKVRVITLTSQIIGFAFESMSTEGRLVLDQSVKEALILNSFKSIPATELPETDRPLAWFHGVFDTNLLLWDVDADRFGFEFENLYLSYSHGSVTLTKTTAAHSEAKGYLAPYLHDSTKVSMGASWLDRAIKILDSSEIKGQFLPALKKLRTLRVQ